MLWIAAPAAPLNQRDTTRGPRPVALQLLGSCRRRHDVRDVETVACALFAGSEVQSEQYIFWQFLTPPVEVNRISPRAM